MRATPLAYLISNKKLVYFYSVHLMYVFLNYLDFQPKYILKIVSFTQIPYEYVPVELSIGWGHIQAKIAGANHRMGRAVSGGSNWG